MSKKIFNDGETHIANCNEFKKMIVESENMNLILKDY